MPPKEEGENGLEPESSCKPPLPENYALLQCATLASLNLIRTPSFFSDTQMMI